jgi:hypothetical protein
MAIDSYESLKTAIGNWTHRSDLDSVVDDFIDLAESRLNSDIRVSQQETSATLAAASMIAIPADCLSIRNIKALTNPVTAIQYLTPEMRDVLDQGDSGTPYAYSIVENQIALYPAPASDIKIVYYTKIPALSSLNTSNWLLELMPDLYLYACLYEAYKYISDDNKLGQYAQLYGEALARLRRNDVERKYSQSLRVRVA